jgi:hypothetical protein
MEILKKERWDLENPSRRDFTRFVLKLSRNYSHLFTMLIGDATGPQTLSCRYDDVRCDCRVTAIRPRFRMGVV